MEFVDGFDLDDHQPFDKEINVEPMANVNSIIDNRDGKLPLETESCFCKLDRKAFLVDQFQQARSELRVNTDCGSNDSFCDLINIHSALSAFSAVINRSHYGLGRGLITW